MTNRTSLLVALAAVLLVATAVGGAAGQAAAVNDTRSASIAIDQPSYVDGDVQTIRSNGSRIYEATGSPLRIVPQNFAPEDVVNYGVETDEGTLSFDEEMQFYRFDPRGQTGTFRMFWVANTQVTVGNGSNATTERRQVRYTTRVRVTNAASMHHLTESEYQQRQDMVELGEYTNDTIADLQDRGLTFFDASGSDRSVVEKMALRAQSTGAPFQALTGGASQFVLLLFLSLGGAFIAGTFLVILAYYILKYWKVYRERQAIRAVEGDVDTKLLEAETRERMASMAKTPWQDVFEDDHVAAGFRNAFGETLLSGWMALKSTLLPENVVRDRLQAMGECGWAARRVESDGGVATEPTYELAKVPDADPAKDDGLEPLTPPRKTVMDGLDWNAEALRTFDLSRADVDANEFDIDAPTLSLPEIIERLDVQKDHWESEEEFGAYLFDFVESVRHNDFCDAEGRPNDVRYAMECFLRVAKLNEDRHHFPTAGFYADAFEYALESHDRAAEIDQFIDDVRDGQVGDD